MGKDKYVYMYVNYPKIQEPVLPDFKKSRFLHADFYCTFKQNTYNLEARQAREAREARV